MQYMTDEIKSLRDEAAARIAKVARETMPGYFGKNIRCKIEIGTWIAAFPGGCGAEGIERVTVSGARGDYRLEVWRDPNDRRKIDLARKIPVYSPDYLQEWRAGVSVLYHAIRKEIERFPLKLIKEGD